MGLHIRFSDDRDSIGILNLSFLESQQCMIDIYIIANLFVAGLCFKHHQR